MYRARDTKLKREVASLASCPTSSHDPDRITRFHRVSGASRNVKSSEHAAIYGLEEFPSTGFRSSPFDSGRQGAGSGTGRGADRVERGHWCRHRIRFAGGIWPTVSIKRSRSRARQIAGALEVAHEKGVVHRDPKPGNVKVKDDGTVKVLDFGLAKALVPEFPEPSGRCRQFTDPDDALAPPLGVIPGTAAHMALRTGTCVPVDRRADIWAFGAVVYEMLSGRRAFTGARRGGHAGRCHPSARIDWAAPS